MHDFAADESEYEWPKCVAGDHRLWAEELDRWACRPCEERAFKNLRELPGLFASVNTTAALMRGARRQGAATSGSKVPPIPPRLEVLSLAAVGGVATRLQAIEDAWRKTLGWAVEPRSDGRHVFASWRTDAARAVPEHVKFLANNLPWACERYEEVGQDMEEIRHLHAECTAALSPDPKPGRVKIGLCPVPLDTGMRCATQLTASTGSFKTKCRTCCTEWDGEDAWRDLRKRQREVLELAVGIGVAA